jgi:hypothetical protein
VALACSCASSPSYRYTPTAPVSRAPKPVDQVEVFLGDEVPRRPFTTTGLFEAETNEAFQHGATILRLRDMAAARGLDGICNAKCGDPGTVGEYHCEAKGFIYAIDGAQQR